jgi:hypothetical protein
MRALAACHLDGVTDLDHVEPVRIQRLAREALKYRGRGGCAMRDPAGAAAGDERKQRGWLVSRSISSRFGTGSSSTVSYLACSISAIARHDCTRAASSGRAASHASTSPRRSAGNSLST